MCDEYIKYVTKAVVVERLRREAKFSKLDGIMLVSVTCYECRRVYQEALGTATSNIAGEYHNVCIKCDNWADM